jgi:hypothetical protein
MQHPEWKFRRRMALPVALLAVALGGCAYDRISEMVPKASDLNIMNFEWTPYSQASSTIPTTFKRREVTAADYVTADGACSGASAEGSAAADPAIVPAVALQMTECEVVRALGAPEKVEIGSNERGERLTRLLYSGGPRPGLYSFSAGRLKVIERVAEPAPPPRQKRAPAQPRRSVG